MGGIVGYIDGYVPMLSDVQTGGTQKVYLSNGLIILHCLGMASNNVVNCLCHYLPQERDVYTQV